MALHTIFVRCVHASLILIVLLSKILSNITTSVDFMAFFRHLKELCGLLSGERKWNVSKLHCNMVALGKVFKDI